VIEHGLRGDSFNAIVAGFAAHALKPNKPRV
jgi:hypothetical protein